MIGEKYVDTWTKEVVTLTELTSEPNYYKFENSNYSVFFFLNERFIPCGT